MRRFLFISRLALAAALAAASLGVEAEDLFQVYRDAQRYDALGAALARPTPTFA